MMKRAFLLTGLLAAVALTTACGSISLPPPEWDPQAGDNASLGHDMTKARAIFTETESVLNRIEHKSHIYPFAPGPEESAEEK